jgi:hypothetical protein
MEYCGHIDLLEKEAGSIKKSMKTSVKKLYGKFYTNTEIEEIGSVI